MTGIYEIANRLNGKRYIGSAVCFNKRWAEHRSLLGRDSHHSKILQQAWNKYGAQAFVFRVLLICAKENLLMFEQACFDGLHPEYNISPTAGSLLGYKTSDETKLKLSKSLAGRKRSPEICAKIGNGHRGKTISAEARAKISAAKIGKKLSAKARANMARSVRARGPEYHAKLSAARMGNKNSLGRKHPPDVIAKISAASKAMWAARRACSKAA